MADDKYYEYEDEGSSHMRYKVIVFLTNVLVTLMCLSTFGLTLWVRFDLDFREWVREINW